MYLEILFPVLFSNFTPPWVATFISFLYSLPVILHANTSKYDPIFLVLSLLYTKDSILYILSCTLLFSLILPGDQSVSANFLALFDSCIIFQGVAEL